MESLGNRRSNTHLTPRQAPHFGVTGGWKVPFLAWKGLKRKKHPWLWDLVLVGAHEAGILCLLSLTLGIRCVGSVGYLPS